MKDGVLYVGVALFFGGAVTIFFLSPGVAGWVSAALYAGAGCGLYMGWRLGAASRGRDVEHYRMKAVSNAAGRNLFVTAIVKQHHAVDVTGEDVAKALTDAEAEVGGPP